VSRHAYTVGCTCARCVKEAARRSAQSAANPPRFAAPKQRRRSHGERYASRAEQHGRYLDSGHGAWDDIGESPDY